MHTGGNDARLKTRLLKSSLFVLKMLVEFIQRGISEILIKAVVNYCDLRNEGDVCSNSIQSLWISTDLWKKYSRIIMILYHKPNNATYLR